MNPNYTFYLWTDIGENRLGLSCAKLRSSSVKCVHPTALNLVCMVLCVHQDFAHFGRLSARARVFARSDELRLAKMHLNEICYILSNIA